MDGWRWPWREFCSWAGRPATLELAPKADDVDLVDEAEHDEVDEALLADDPEDEVLPGGVEAPAEVEVPTEVAAPERWGWSALTFQETIACWRVLHGQGWKLRHLPNR